MFINKAGETGSELVFASDEWIIESNTIKHDSLLSLKASERFHDNNLDVNLGLTGTYQLKKPQDSFKCSNAIETKGI